MAKAKKKLPPTRSLRAMRREIGAQLFNTALRAARFLMLIFVAATVIVILVAEGWWPYVDSWLESHDGLITAIATVILVVITWRYVRATYDLVAVSRRSRREQIRPLFHISRIDVTRRERGQYSDFSFAFEVVNTGAAAAVASEVLVSIPLVQGGEVVNWTVTTTEPALSLLLPQNVIEKRTASLIGRDYDEALFGRDFLEIEINYEDIDGNLYHHQTSYRLFVQERNAGTKYYAYVTEEILHFLSSSARTGLRDSRNIWWAMGGGEILLHRVGHF